MSGNKIERWIMKRGEKCVGKSIMLGLFEPEIPENLRELHRKQNKSVHKLK